MHHVVLSLESFPVRWYCVLRGAAVSGIIDIFSPVTLVVAFGFATGAVALILLSWRNKRMNRRRFVCYHPVCYHQRPIEERALPGWLYPSRPPSMMAHPKPMLVGVGSVFNLAGAYFSDDPITGFLELGSTSFEEDMELSAACLDQAEDILAQTEDVMWYVR